MLKENERSKFLYDTKKLLPYQRKEMALNFITKAKDLFEQELIIDALYNQMDYKTIDIFTKNKYKNAIQSLSKIIDELK